MKHLSRPMRILHILDHSIPLHSGYTFRTISILKEQRARGWETYQITSAKQGRCKESQETVDGWEFFRTPLPTGVAPKLPVVNQLAIIDSLTRRLTEVVEAVRPDILHAHSPALNAIAALRVSQRFNIPVVYEIRAFWEDAAVDHGTSKEWGLRYRMTRALESFAIRKAHAVTTICEGLRSEIITRGVPPEKITVIPNGVNIDDFTIGQEEDELLRHSLNLEGKLVLGFIGSFYAYEGLNVLLDAAPLMIEKNSDIRILLVGGGQQDAALKNQAQRLSIGDKVLFTGRVPHDQVHKYYNLIDILIYPRLKMRLTDLVTPLKPLEAMAQGRLLAASNVGGHFELICDGKTGVLFEAGSPTALAESVLNFSSCKDSWPALRSAARTFVETERNWRVSVERYRAVYKRLVPSVAT